MSLKVILVYFSLLAFLSSCVKDNELAKIGVENGAYHNLDIHVNSSDVMDSRAANPAEIAETIADVALFVVDNNSREILDVSMMQKKSEGLYSCLIPSAISLTTSNFYAVANVGANFTNIPGMKGKTLDFLLDTKLQPNNTDNKSASVSPHHYVFMNNTAATYNQATNSISNITLSRLPSRIYLDCTKLGYPVEQITFKNIAKQTTLRTIIDKRGNVTDADVLDWQDTDPQITADGKSYYYLVYPSRKNAAIIITANGQGRQVDLGEIKPGSTYTLRINYPQNINFDGITTGGVINNIIGNGDINEFKVSNTAHIRTVRFTSSDTNIFTVTAGTGADWYKFTIKGINPGEATLTAICDGVTITCQVIITGALGASTVTVNGTPIGSYNTGDVVRVNAPFVEFQKFSSWTANPLITATNKPSFTFTMPQHNVEFTANYVKAPYKLTVNKPGRIANDRSGTIDTALIQQTAINDVRYYELNDEVCITIPNEDKLFVTWGSTSTQINFNLNTIGGGGNDKPTSWFKMPNIGNNEVITPNLKRKPYWSSRATAKGHIIANFVDRINPAAVEGNFVTIPGNATFGRAYTEVEKSAIMRALNKIENIFADEPRRPLKITFSIAEGDGTISGGGTEPMIADRNRVHESYDLPKLKWQASDMGGRAIGKDAASSKFEAVWRDKKNIYPDDADNYDNNFVGFCDGYVTLYDGFVSHPTMYKGESIEGFNGSATDFETVIMHEVAHIICYHAYSTNYVDGGEGLTALDVYIGEEKDRNKSLVNGNFTMGGHIQIVPLLYSEAVHKRLGEYPIINPSDFQHLNFDGLGAHQYMHMWGKKQYRRFADFELDMLQEMGWKINPTAWQVPPR